MIGSKCDDLRENPCFFPLGSRIPASTSVVCFHQLLSHPWQFPPQLRQLQRGLLRLSNAAFWLVLVFRELTALLKSELVLPPHSPKDLSQKSLKCYVLVLLQHHSQAFDSLFKSDDAVLHLSNHLRLCQQLSRVFTFATSSALFPASLYLLSSSSQNVKSSFIMIVFFLELQIPFIILQSKPQ